ncbi:hypothetical protein BWQ96_09123 [Gracilariopsis chorda]|uniref:Uncharacterized protein n=1 Tax=Gracilariopsis chorda TaxID=448386 RepID=A0A2V3IGC7_9FLOR|nr:hypothetical protein BWQ96_09123 [Gracilariopsis chorda]|eukprot:PXF41156.1 hypothetical protein BWQ96_09123 [Gracilariopsis chorda]
MDKHKSELGDAISVLRHVKESAVSGDLRYASDALQGVALTTPDESIARIVLFPTCPAASETERPVHSPKTFHEYAMNRNVPNAHYIITRI